MPRCAADLSADHSDHEHHPSASTGALLNTSATSNSTVVASLTITLTNTGAASIMVGALLCFLMH